MRTSTGHQNTQYHPLYVPVPAQGLPGWPRTCTRVTRVAAYLYKGYLGGRIPVQGLPGCPRACARVTRVAAYLYKGYQGGRRICAAPAQHVHAASAYLQRKKVATSMREQVKGRCVLAAREGCHGK